MPNDSAPTDVYRFGNYELRLQSRELLLDGDVVSMEPRVFDLLAFLLHNRERVVTKDQLLEAVWPGTFVSETSLSRCVMKARRAVGDDADSQHSIRTVHGRGYRFVADLVASDSVSVADARVSVSTDASGASGRETILQPRNGLALAAGAVAVALVVLAIALFPQSDEPAGESAVGVPRIAVLPIDNATGDPNLDWIRFGLMDVLAGQLQQQSGLRVAASSEIVAILERPRSASDDAEAGDVGLQLLQQLGATHLVRAALEQPGQLYRLEAEIVAEDGSRSDVELLGNEPLGLVTELRRVIDDRVAGARRTTLVARVISDDVFVNEAYARGRDQILRGNLEEAYTLLQAAVGQEPDNFWARHALATVILNRGDPVGAADILGTLVEEARRDGRALEEATSLFVLGTTYLRRDDFDTAQPLYEEALSVFEALAMSFEQGQVLNNMAIIAGRRQELTEERALLERAATAFNDAGLEATPGYILGGLANNAMDRGQLEDAQRYMEQALTAFREQGLQNQEAVSLYSLSQVAQFRGDFAAARTLAEQSRDIARDIGQRWGEAASIRRLGKALLAQGDLDGAEAMFQEALALSRDIGARTNAAATLTELADIARLRGRHEEAAQLVAESAVIVEETNDPVGAMWVEIQRGRVALDRGDVAGALAAADQVLVDEDAVMTPQATDAYRLRGRALLAEGDMAGASQALESAYRVAEQGSDRVRRAKAAALLGRLSIGRERDDLALAYLGLARDAAPEIYQVLALSAAVAAREGNWDEAIRLLDTAKQRAGGLWTDEDERLRLNLTAEAPVTRGESPLDPD